jgi:integrase
MATHSIAQRPHVVPFPQSVPKRDPHRNRPKMAFLTTNKIVAVLKAARERSTRDWAMILLAYRHGLRASEICGLRLADVDLKNFAVTIERLKGSLKTVQPLSEQRGQP